MRGGSEKDYEDALANKSQITIRLAKNAQTTKKKCACKALRVRNCELHPLIHTILKFEVAQNVEGCQGNVHTKEKRMNARGIQPLIIPNYLVIEVFAQPNTPKIFCLLHVFHKSGENIQNYSLKENTHVLLLCTLLLQHTLSP